MCRQPLASSKDAGGVASVDWEPDNPNNDIERVLAVQHCDGCISKLSEARDDEVQATVRLGHRKSKNPWLADVNVFPDSGATICVTGPHVLEGLGIPRECLIPCKGKRVRVVGGATIPCIGWIWATFTINGVKTTQKLFVCEGVDRIFFSKRACIDVYILPPNFPQPMTMAPNTQQSVCLVTDNSAHKQPNLSPQHSSPSTARKPPPPPKPRNIPHAFVESSIPVLKKYIIDAFKDTAFSKDPPFPAMNHRKGHIHLKPDAIPYAVHSPIPVPHHEKELIKQQLDDQEARGIIQRVPIGTPVIWCAQMVIVYRKDGRPRIVVDYQRLNRQCLRETHHCAPPFHVASQVPPGTKKTVLDAVDSYHSVELDNESQLLTTFITEWGRYMYLRVPQGFIAAGDMFTSRFDDIIAGIPRKVKIIDDTLIHSDSIEDSFWNAWDFLTVCAENGVVVNEDKFQFCQDEVEFAGLNVTNDGIKPSQSILSAIENFPPPSDLTSARSWFGLVNQVSWAYSLGPIMQPFRHLIQPNNKFYWDETLSDIFNKSKAELIHKVKEGVKSFQLGRRTCLQTDWSKQGIGYLLLQKHCSCTDDTNVHCCPEGWRLIFAGSRFTKPAESRYSPTEGEALAVAWGLEHSKMFTLGCTNLVVSVDHKPLLGILNDRDLGNIDNPRLQNLKEHTLKWTFTIVHNPGKLHVGPDAVSRNPSIHSAELVEHESNTNLLSIIRSNNVSFCDNDFNSDNSLSSILYLDDLNDSNSVDDYAQSVGIRSLHSMSPEKITITLNDVHSAGQGDPVYQTLMSTIENGFPATRSLTDASIRKFWEVRHRLHVQSNIIYMDKRLVIPSKLQKEVLENLHSANQGVTGMRKRANNSVYWPGMSASISNFRNNCIRCEENAPSQPREPISLSPPPEWPFQQIAADYFEIDTHAYLIAVDRYSGYPCISHFKPGQTTSNHLIRECRQLFSTYGVPEEWGSDGGPQFTSHTFQTFLNTWGIHHRLSSAEYPQSNGRAEVGVKTAKRILLDNLAKDGSLNNDKVTAALLQYKNTPLPDVGLSPAQILFHQELRDTVPSHRSNYHLHKDWIIAADEREALFAKRNRAVATRYNQHTRALGELAVGTYVLIQTAKNKWKKQGVIVEKLDHRQYRVKVLGSGRVTLRNRRFLKPCAAITPPAIPAPCPSTPHEHPPNKSISVSHEVLIPNALPAGNVDNPHTPHPMDTPHTSHPQPPTSHLQPPVDAQIVSQPPTSVSTGPRSHQPVGATAQPLSVRTRSSARLQQQSPQRFETDPAKLPLKLRKLLSHNNPGLLD